MLLFILLAIALIAVPLYNLLFLSTSPTPYRTSTPPRPTAPAAGASPTPVSGGGWCTDFGGVFERFSPYVEICYFPPLQNQSSSSSHNKRR
jgi:hypothetical protein